MSFFKKRKVKKFAQQVQEKEVSLFIFGSDIFAEILVERLVEMGVKDKLALISDKNMLWIEELEEEITVLIEERQEEYGKPNLYSTVGFHTAEKIIILHSDQKIIQNILSFVQPGEETKIILLSQYAPPFVHYLASARPDQMIIVDDIENVVSQLYELLELKLTKPPVIDVPAPKSMVGMPADVFKIPKVEMIRISRDGQLIPLKNRVKTGDRLLIYLHNGEDSIKEFISFSEAMSAKNRSLESVKQFLLTEEEIEEHSLMKQEDEKELTSVKNGE
ncbi:MAG: hypothetical protein ACFFD4_04205 [Candidatus Odinarchaeota archaeon]